MLCSLFWKCHGAVFPSRDALSGLYRRCLFFLFLSLALCRETEMHFSLVDIRCTSSSEYSTSLLFNFACQKNDVCFNLREEWWLAFSSAFLAIESDPLFSWWLHTLRKTHFFVITALLSHSNIYSAWICFSKQLKHIIQLMICCFKWSWCYMVGSLLNDKTKRIVDR